MKKHLLLLCLSMVLLVSACSNGTVPRSDESSVSAPESSSEKSDITESDNNNAESSQNNLLEEAQCPVPDFLDAEQQALYRKAQTAYKEFTYDNSGFGSGGSEAPVLEQNEMQYYKCNGTITKWADFEYSMLSVFTKEFFEELNNKASYTDGDGVYHARTIFAEQGGDLYYSGGARGGNITFVGPEAFELISKDDNEIQFNVVGTYDDYAEDADGEFITDDNGELRRAGNPVTEKFLIVMKNTSDGWRFNEFALAY